MLSIFSPKQSEEVEMPSSSPNPFIPRFRFGFSPPIARLRSTLDHRFWSELEKQGKVQLTDEAKSDISIVMAMWSELKQFERRLAVKKRNEALAAFKVYSDNLAEMIKAAQNDSGVRFILPDCADRLLAHLCELSEYCNIMLGLCSNRISGRPKTEFRTEELIFQLARIYYAAGGTPRVGGGPFTRFLRVVWGRLPRELWPSENAFVGRARASRPKLREAENTGFKSWPSGRMLLQGLQRLDELERRAALKMGPKT